MDQPVVACAACRAPGYQQRYVCSPCSVHSHAAICLTYAYAAVAARAARHASMHPEHRTSTGHVFAMCVAG